jgi:hypothetical protein
VHSNHDVGLGANDMIGSLDMVREFHRGAKIGHPDGCQRLGADCPDREHRNHVRDVGIKFEHLRSPADFLPMGTLLYRKVSAPEALVRAQGRLRTAMLVDFPHLSEATGTATPRLIPHLRWAQAVVGMISTVGRPQRTPPNRPRAVRHARVGVEDAVSEPRRAG